jgi:hypothetical protein
MARFKSHIRMLPNECWEWTGGMFNGYGYMGNCNATRYAHRWYWIQVNGPVPNDAPLDHYRYPERGCIGRACCNPDHVRPVTHWENILRGVGPTAQNKAKTHCPDEHEYTPENTYLTPSGGRGCRECTRRAGREWYAKRGRALRQARRDAERR